MARGVYDPKVKLTTAVDPSKKMVKQKCELAKYKGKTSLRTGKTYYDFR